MVFINDLIDRIRTHPDCTVFPSTGLPSVRTQDRLPDDLRQFYRLCGGARLFSSAGYPLEVVRPHALSRANPEIIGEECPDDITDSWYIVVRGGSEEALSIDLNPMRLGRCYDSFWDRHGVAGDCAVVALSFVGLLDALVRANGEYWFWLEAGFVGHGDAYDPP